MAVFSALTIFAMIFYQRKSTQLEQIEWDVSTVTASDYTVDMTLTEGMLENFMKEVNPGKEESAAYALKKYLQQTLEEKLTNEVPYLGFQKISRVKVADIQFTYKNGELMKVLRQRGSSIKNNDWDEYKRVNLVLDDVKRDLYRDCVTPVSAFVTFELEEGMERCLTLGDSKSRVRVLGE